MADNAERTLVIVKPDGVRRGLIGEVLGRYERLGLQIVAAKFIQVSTDLAEEHYAEHVDKPFFDDLVDYITSCPVLAAVVEGQDAIAAVRAANGATDPAEAEEGTVRGDHGLNIQENVVHGSDSADSAKREIDLWFDDADLHAWEPDQERWVRD